MKKVALIGNSGHAFVSADILQQSGYKIVGYFDKSPVTKNLLQLEYLGYEGDDDFESRLKGVSLFPAIGDNHLRRKVFEFILERKLLVATAISPGAEISPYASIGQGTLVCQGACINPFASIGFGVIINTAAVIEHECIINNFAHIAPGAVLAGNVQIGENSFVGANAVVKQGVKIGKNVLIGAGSVVLNNIPDNEVWVGNPAKRIK